MATTIQKQKQAAEPTVEFTLPNDSIFKALPTSISPYIEITRMHIPPLNLVCFYPFVIGIAFVANDLYLSSSEIVRAMAVAYPVALLCGAAGHAMDDAVDYDIDRLYPRCASRPIIRGAISRQAAYAYALGLLTVVQVAISKIYGSDYVPYGLLFAAMTWVYPASKQFCNYPQLVIAVLHSIPIPWLAFSLGVTNLPAVLAMAAAFGTNTTIFDIGYGLIDAEEDRKHGVGSMSAYFQSNVKSVLTIMSAMHLSALAIAGYAASFGTVYYAGCMLKAGMLAYLIANLKPKNAKSSIDFFMTVSSFGGAQIILSLFGDYIYRLYSA